MTGDAKGYVRVWYIPNYCNGNNGNQAEDEVKEQNQSKVDATLKTKDQSDATLKPSNQFTATVKLADDLAADSRQSVNDSTANMSEPAGPAELVEPQIKETSHLVEEFPLLREHQTMQDRLIDQSIHQSLMFGVRPHTLTVPPSLLTSFRQVLAFSKKNMKFWAIQSTSSFLNKIKCSS